MIIIKSCEVIDVGDVTIKDIYRYPPLECLPVNDYSAVAEVSVIQELIRGRRFVRPSDGIDVYLGCTKEAQDLIGIQYNHPTRVYLGYLSYCLLRQDTQSLCQFENTDIKNDNKDKVFGLEIYHCSDDKNHIYVC